MDNEENFEIDDENIFQQGNESDMESQNVEEPIDNIENDNESLCDDETIEIINKLSPKDKETVKSYAKSLINTDEEENTENDNVSNELNNENPIQENFIFNKKQLNNIMETFSDFDDVEKNEKKTEKKHKSIPKSSPFNSPEFK